ncbi:glutathione S-transferase family protein [Pseudoalteromonas sp. S16_S37]|uniref:glutathione S-transferase family protein n=1 Tax=Pseudoalteromonas sp. S16_S37 TaxID=2720228 RepID=UPI001680684F|nr:glutathione S-transferase family protein [Pseudoalteromonas sp. S16_S37]MBD1584624.1 glutathione S-transferase family protein [Pseudoalteromonas sp. S16_S37]
MIKVHHLNQSRSTRVLWLLEELGLPYEVERHERDSATRLAPASLAKVHPLSKAPIIEHNGTILCESGAIMEYILDQAPDEHLRPEKGTKEYYQYLEWLHFAEGSLALPVITSLLMQMEQRDGTKAMDGYISKELKLDFSYIDKVLAKQRYFAGEQFCAADIMMTITLEIANSLNLLEGHANIARYLGDMQTREAYKKARAFG